LVQPLKNRGLGNFIRNKQVGYFDPWRNPVSLDGLRDAAREWLLLTFSVGLAPEQRWGFKEIRYSGQAVTRFLLTLFPHCQFVILRRNLTELCISNVLADWSLDKLQSLGSFEDEAEAAQVVADCAYAIAAFDMRLADAARIAGASALSIKSEELVNRGKEIFEFLALPMNGKLEAELAQVILARRGQTNKDLRLGLLNRDFILKWAEHYIPLAVADIRTNGVDRMRLMGVDGKGKFCFLIGDHNLQGTKFSSMGW
jgi:hypothetical protein